MKKVEPKSRVKRLDAPSDRSRRVISQLARDHDVEKRRESLGDVAYRRVKFAVIECELLPGEELSQRELVERFKLTNAQARHALVRLAQEGWVNPMPRRGYVVTPLTMQDLEDVFEMRMMIEPPALQKAAGRIDAETFKRLEKVGQAEYEPGNPESIRAFLRANRDFYTLLMDAAGNRLLTKIVDQLFDSANRLLYFSMVYSYEAEIVRRGHERLLEVLRRANGREAARLRRAGLEHAKIVVQKALLSSPSLMGTNLAPRRGLAGGVHGNPTRRGHFRVDAADVSGRR
jgi:DNA-binding GntR family transcriptional regulator